MYAMKKQLFYLLFGLVTMVTVNTQLHGQSTTQPVHLEKGEILDILLLTQKPDTKEDLNAYFQTAFPVAKRMSYQPVPGFRILELTQGNHQPTSLILGKWSDKETREAFLSQILEEVPDFHERRRTIWSYFGLSYYEIQEETTIAIDRNKYHVATAYWLESKKESSDYFEEWLRQVDKMGGEVFLHLQDGSSPYGYQYAPDYFVITAWENESNFKAFQQIMQQTTPDNIQHINELTLE